MAEITTARSHSDFASSSTASGSAPSPFDHYDVFINLCDYNHSGRDVHTFATKLYNQLRFLQLQVFMDKPDLLFKDNILPSKIEDAIIAASVHIAIFSPNYAQSKWCLDELVLMTKMRTKSRSTIIPVFYYAKPTELRLTGKDHEGGYAKALRSYENQNLYDSLTIQKWRDALSQVTEISGFVLDDGHGGEEDLLNNVVQSVTSDFPFGSRYDVFINHRGPDVKETFATSLYDRLVSRGLRVFLDEPELVRGFKIDRQLEVAIQVAYINIAIFSPNYAGSTWCLDELKVMVRSTATILPVFYKVRRSDVQSPDNGVYNEALIEHERKQRYDWTTLQVWRDALSNVAKLPGHELDSDEEELLDKTVQSVLENLAKRSEAVRNYELESVVKSVLKETVPNRFEVVQSGSGEQRAIRIAGTPERKKKKGASLARFFNVGGEDLLNRTRDFPFGPRYDFFINHRGPDSRGSRVFLDEPEFAPGIMIGRQLEYAIEAARRLYQ